MPTKQRLIPYDDVRVLLSAGLSQEAVAKRLKIPRRTLTDHLSRTPLSADLSDIPAEVWARYPDIARPTASCVAPPQDGEGLDLSWDEIADYLGTGLSLEETATAAGVDVAGLAEAYARDQPATFDCLATWAAVLRARRNFDLMKAAERRALNGDLRALVILQKQKYQRWPKDTVAPPNMVKGI